MRTTTIIFCGRELRLSEANLNPNPNSGFFGNWDCLPDDVKLQLNEIAAREIEKQSDIIRRLQLLADYGMSKGTIYR